jgi:hypothetical protein
MMRGDVGNGFASIPESFHEIVHVITRLLAFGEPRQRIIGQRIVFHGVNRFARQFDPVEEYSSLGPFDQQASVEDRTLVVDEENFGTVGVRALDVEASGSLVSVRNILKLAP